ncbi:EAL domain-containing protein [Deinococcus sp. HMF7604]|uniref:EAL domain-containing protein n=1 Tax=Deinococcus betulae TaxID=2873312 RepID=UPI001CC96958|nr:EAL domain-containing protein [Deinococcus betulae]MBZ9749478.1 EAL domain-containing protein [Deinococcus betulae]
MPTSTAHVLPAPSLRDQLRAMEDGMYRRPEAARAELVRLLGEAQQASDPWAQAFALVLLSGCAFYLGEPRETIRLASEGLMWARSAQAPEVECRLMNGLALAHHRLGEYDRAFDYFLQTLRLAQQMGDDANRFRALNNLASLYTDTGNLQQALESLEEALGIAQQLTPPFLGAAMTYMIDVRTQLGEYETVLALAEEHMPLIRAHCPPRWQGTIQRNVVRALLALGRPHEALAAAQVGLEEARRQQDHENICEMKLAVGNAFLHLGQLAEARPLLERGLTLSRAKGSRPLETEALRLLAELHERLGDHEVALGYTRAHFDLERQIHAREVESRSQLLTAQIRLELLQREAEIERLRNVELAQANTALQETQQVLLHRATHDPLTGVANRAHFGHSTQQALDSLQGGEHLGLIFIDLDKFKQVNDTLGHHAGDQLLQEVARRLRSVVRATDLVGRIGGDEFTVLLRRVSAVPDARAVAAKLLGVLAEPFRIAGQMVQITASVGCAVAPTDGQDAEALQQHADLAMYRVKHTGGNQVLHFEAEMGEPAERRQLERDLRGAHERGELRLHYQGRFALHGVTPSGPGLVGFEALIRWEHPERGLVPPVVFIPMAEDSRAILPIGAWVLREACTQAVRWQFAERGLAMSVNVSPMQFEQPSFVQDVQAALEAAGLRPEALVLELTESLVMRDLALAQNHIQDLKALGVQIAIDDFGTGYSSLSVLQALPFDQLKIDRSFTSHLTTSASQRVTALLTAMIQLAHSLEMTVTVEGVEDETQRRLLTGLGCDHVQGFLLARPLPPAQAQSLLPAGAESPVPS